MHSISIKPWGVLQYLFTLPTHKIIFCLKDVGSGIFRFYQDFLQIIGLSLHLVSGGGRRNAVKSVEIRTASEAYKHK